MTWHQWHAAYPTEMRTGTSRRLASSKASDVHGHQSTGLSTCWSRYGEVASARRFGIRRSSRARTARATRGRQPQALSSAPEDLRRASQVARLGPSGMTVAEVLEAAESA